MSFWRMPLDSGEQKVVVGRAHIIAYRCKGCKFCIEFCPRDVLAESPDFNERGYHAPFVKVEGKCVNCNYCETVCPEFAIYVTVEEQREPHFEEVVTVETKGRKRPGARREK
jgi:2-oxoglutarate ferredoxin oxidoreductase subunit delta